MLVGGTHRLSSLPGCEVGGMLAATTPCEAVPGLTRDGSREARTGNHVRNFTTQLLLEH